MGAPCSHKVALSKPRKRSGKRSRRLSTTRGSSALFRDIAANLGGSPKQHQEVLEWMLAKGILIKTKDDIYFHAATLTEFQRRLVAWLKEHGEITTTQFKEMTQASRKYTIPLLEYFDAQKLTIRVGEVRKLRDIKAAG